MRLQLEIDGQTIEAEFSADNGNAQLKLDGRAHEAQVSEPEPGIYTVLLDNRVYACLLDRSPAGATEVVVNGTRHVVAARDRKRLRGNAGGAAGAGGRAVLLAPMPGKIVRVLCKAGDEVAANQGLLVVEAMKMQNEVQSPKAGKVAEIKVAEGQTVNAGETLAVIE
ncbi:MAG: biotin/lipoyl-containing protein [Blastocatellia bacterium]